MINKRVTLYQIMTKLYSILTKVIPMCTFGMAFTNSNLKYKSYYFSILHTLGCLKQDKPLFKVSWKPKKCKNRSSSSNLLKPQYSSFQMQYSHKIFVNSFSNFHPRIKIWLFLDSGKTRLLTIVKNQFQRCFGSQEMSKTKIGTFF